MRAVLFLCNLQLCGLMSAYMRANMHIYTPTRISPNPKPRIPKPRIPKPSNPKLKTKFQSPRGRGLMRPASTTPGAGRRRGSGKPWTWPFRV